MEVQVLIATMNQKDYSLLDKMCVKSNAVVVNQCDEQGLISFEYKGFNITWINSTERGLSRSRNQALENATGDICLLCDDDEVLATDYAKILQKAYQDLPNASMICFNLELKDCDRKETLFDQPRKIKKHKSYGSCHLSFLRKKVIDNGIKFNVNFGAGSKKYLSCEDNLFCLDFHKKGLDCYTYPAIIGSVSYANSTWFTGYNENFFYDRGAFLVAGFSCKRYIFKWYYVYRFRKLSSLSAREILKNINRGIKGYKKGLSYAEYISLNQPK